MVWQPEIEELERRKRVASEMGGAERIARQHADGKLARYGTSVGGAVIVRDGLSHLLAVPI